MQTSTAFGFAWVGIELIQTPGHDSNSLDFSSLQEMRHEASCGYVQKDSPRRERLACPGITRGRKSRQHVDVPFVDRESHRLFIPFHGTRQHCPICPARNDIILNLLTVAPATQQHRRVLTDMSHVSTAKFVMRVRTIVPSIISGDSG